ncbi:response regulator [Prosthecobacter sp.]|uniref:response regulator n=1 Tax=Prosthecobacter sp. TaxID=1965333 RepID=UPI0037852035
MIATLETEAPAAAIRPLQVAVIEDDATLRLFLKKLVSKPGTQLTFAGAWESAEAAAKPLLETRPDVVVVDLELPNMCGMDLIRHLSPRMPATAFVVLTIHDEPQKVFAALRAGASGYLLKSSKPAEIIAGIRQASAGGAPLSQEIARLLIQSFQAPAKTVRKRMPGLTPRESQILEMLAQGKVPKEVAEDLGLTYATVRDYLKAVYAKLHVRSRTEAVIKFLDQTQ